MIDVRQPWQVTRQEYAGGYPLAVNPCGNTDPEKEREHEEIVKQALREGKAVPQEVLEDYPLLAASCANLPSGEVVLEEIVIEGKPVKLIQTAFSF